MESVEDSVPVKLEPDLNESAFRWGYGDRARQDLEQPISNLDQMPDGRDEIVENDFQGTVIRNSAIPETDTDEMQGSEMFEPETKVEAVGDELEKPPCPMCVKAKAMNKELKKLATQEQLSSVEPYDCKLCGKKFSFDDPDQLESVTSASLNLFECKSCNVKLVDKSLLEEHLSSNNCEDVSRSLMEAFASLKCDICDATFSTKMALGVHMRRKHKAATGPRGPLKKNFKCSNCKEKFTTKKELDLHFIEFHTDFPVETKLEEDEDYDWDPNFEIKNEADDLEYTDNAKGIDCNYCDEKLSSKLALKKHIRSVHGTIKPFQCLCCIMTFAEEDNLKRHMLAVHTEKSSAKVLEDEHKSFQCDICKLRYYEKNGLVRHIKRVHEQPQPECLECKVCQAKFFDKKLLTKHIHAVHETIKPFQCNECDMAFKKNRYLLKHKVVVHKEVKSYPCRFCNEVFPLRKEVRLHLLQAHENTARNQCDLCGKQLSCRAALWAHINQVHEKRQPYQCETCGKNFSTKEQMKRHKQFVHEKIRPFQCHLCGKSFQNKFFLKSHIQNHNRTPAELAAAAAAKKEKIALAAKKKSRPQGPRDKTKAKPFECHVCLIKFTIKSNLRRHLRKIHPEVTVNWTSIEQDEQSVQ